MISKKNFSRALGIIATISILVILSGCLIDDKINTNKINYTKDRIKELNDRSILYSENGWTLFKSGTSKLSSKGSIPENIALLEVSLEPLTNAEDYFKKGHQTQLEIYNLTWDLSQMNAINDSEFERNKMIVEINVGYYKSMIEGVQYEIKAHNEFLAGYRLIKDEPSDEVKILNFIASIIAGKPDFSQLGESKFSSDAQIRFKKGGEYFKSATDSTTLYGIQRFNKENLEKSLQQIPDCIKVECDAGDLGSAGGTMLFYTTNYESYCVMEECSKIEQKSHPKTGDIRGSIESWKELIVYVSKMYPPRKIDI